MKRKIKFNQLEQSLWEIKDGGNTLGFIEWSPGLKQYVFNTFENLNFSTDYLTAIVEFIKDL